MYGLKLNANQSYTEVKQLIEVSGIEPSLVGWLLLAF